MSTSEAKVVEMNPNDNQGSIKATITGGMKVGDERIPTALLEILVYGEENDRKEIDAMIDKIQNQMDLHKRGKYARILWYVDKGEKNVDEKKQWLTENAKCKYYIFAPDNRKVKSNWIQNILTKIKKLEDSFISLKSSQVFIKNYSAKKKEVKNEDNSEKH